MVLSYNELLKILTKLKTDLENAKDNKNDYTNNSIRNLEQRIRCYEKILNNK
jgi:hypothetical protein